MVGSFRALPQLEYGLLQLDTGQPRIWHYSSISPITITSSILPTPDDPRTNQWGKYPRLTYGTTYNNRIQSDWNEYKGDYFKLKNIQIGYTLPQRISSKFFVNKLRAFVSMDNILTITSYPGLDPEIGTAIGYPLMRQISFGGQITF